MANNEFQLRSLRVEDETSFRAAVRDFMKSDPDFQFAFDYDESSCFADYVQLLEQWALGKKLPQNFVPNTYLVGVVNDTVIGRVSIRHTLNDFLKHLGGHVGYAVVQSHRRQGYATTMLKQSLPIAAALGIDRMLVTCDADNVASQRVIESNGGVFEGLVNGDKIRVPKRRYWIDLSRHKYAS